VSSTWGRLLLLLLLAGFIRNGAFGVLLGFRAGFRFEKEKRRRRRRRSFIVDFVVFGLCIYASVVVVVST